MADEPKILVVDDDPLVLDTLKELLKQCSTDIQTAKGGKEAITVLNQTTFDLVFLDIVMPEIDGFQVMDHIFSLSPDTLVVIITGYTSSESAIEAMRKGAYYYVSKPIEDEELLKVAENALYQKILKSERRQAEEELRKAYDELEKRVEARTEELSKANERLQHEISERIQAEENLKRSLNEKEILLKEIHHRVKNNLQTIDSLINLQCKDIKDKASANLLKESQNRIRAMAFIHEKLYESQSLAGISFSEYINSLTTYLYHSYGIDQKSVNLKTDLEEVSLDIDTAIPCGLIINELVSNSLKHAFPKGENGEITIGLYLADAHLVTLEVTDNGVGIPKDMDLEHTKSLGLGLLNLFVQQLDGSIEIDGTAGTTFRVVFPLPKQETI
jgi:two-component sensor histidine kinase/CheY-like chemotaxis protein